jgi:lysophospholipase L1-like esterase
MKFPSPLVLLGALGFLLPAPAAHAQANPPKEIDPGLHADGKGWRLQKALVEDKSRPRVLMIGDSILNGYLPGVTKALEGKAYIDAWVTPTSQGDKSLPRQISEVLAQGPYDIIHFNLGLHGWQKGRIPEGQFEPLTHAMVQAFKQNAPKAALIWATTTPVTRQDHPGELDPEINPTIVEHNAMAATVMKKEGVPVENLNALMMQHLDLARGDRFHWKPEGTSLLVKKVSETLLKVLDERAGR